jgi:hypothetical protein
MALTFHCNKRRVMRDRRNNGPNMKRTQFLSLICLLGGLRFSSSYNSFSLKMSAKLSSDSPIVGGSTRKSFLANSVGAVGAAFLGASLNPDQVNAIGPVKVELINPVYTAAPCPPSKPIPGQMAMKGMKGLVS